MQDDLNFKINLNENDANAYGSQKSTDVKYAPKEETKGEAPQPKRGGLFSFFSVEFYQPFFDVTTEDVKRRLLTSIDPRKNTFFDVIGDRADLYGPFWICTTLIFTLAATGNFSGYLNAKANSVTYHSNFDFVPAAASIVYGFGLAVPIIFTALLKWFGSSSVKFIDTICIYGYSLFIMVPAMIIAVIPLNIVQWISLMVATASSTWFLLNNFAHELGKYVGNQRYILLGFIGCAQAVLLLIFKLKFFDIYIDSDPNN